MTLYRSVSTYAHSTLEKILYGGKVVGYGQSGTALKDVSICGKQSLAHIEVCTYTAAIYLLLPLFFS